MKLINGASGFILILIFFLPAFVFAANSDIAISEALFDPAGADTGLEYVIIRNFGNADVNLSGWDLYPAGVGYYTFPDFILSADSEVKIHIRASGSGGAADLYHASASGNIGNASGSIALFSSTTHNKDTIVAFVRYHKSGSSESKTWESAASDAGIWSAGDSVDISSFSEGQIIKLENVNQKTSSRGWVIEDSGSSSVSQGVLAEENSGDEDTRTPEAQSEGGEKVVIVESASKIKADAGEDRTVLSGAGVVFAGSMDGVSGSAASNVRFYWNFGDGYAADGKSVVHAFSYPGVYNIFLTVSVAGILSSDAVKITAIENPVMVSEIKPSGFIEIRNDSSRKIDFSGFGIRIDDFKPFYFSAGTFLAPYAYLAFEKGLLGFDIPQSAAIKLLYPSGKILFSSDYSAANLGEKESLGFVDNQWFRSGATPGAKNEILKKAVGGSKNLSTSAADGIALKTKESETKSEETVELNDVIASVQLPTSNISLLLSGEYFWLVIGLGVGVLIGSIFLAAKRYFL